MHLGNGAITTECAYLTLGAAAGGLAWAAAASRRDSVDRSRLLTAGALGAAVFAAQMVNVPVLPYSSGHLVGGVLLAWCLGPAWGALSMAVILAVQAIFLGDGGVMALGANILNMALLPAGMVWLGRKTLSGERPVWQLALAAGTLSAVSVLAAAGLIVAEVSLFRSGDELSNLGRFASAILGLHAWIGLGEAVITCATLFALGSLMEPARARLGRRQLAGTLGTAALLLAVLPFSSALPDGFEAAAEGSGLKSLLLEGGVAFSWQTSLQETLASTLPGEQLVALAATCLAGLLATGIILACRVRLVAIPVSKKPRG